MIKTVFTLCALLAMTPSFTLPLKAKVIDTGKTPITKISFNEGNFSASNGFSVTKNGSGFVADNTYVNGFNVSDNTSYLEIASSNNSAFAGEHGFSIVLNLSNKEGDTGHQFEQIFSYEGSSGEAAYICLGGLYYYDGSSATYVQPKGNKYTHPDSTLKSQIYVVDFDKGEIYNYVNGALSAQFLTTNSRAEYIGYIVDLLKELQEKNNSLFFRKPCPAKTPKSRNGTSLIASDIQFYDSVFTEDEIAEIYSSSIREDLPITVASCDDATIKSIGDGVQLYTDSTHPNSFGITDASSYISLSAGNNTKLTQNGNGFSLSFYQRSTTDTYYSGNTDLRPDVTDDFEQLLTVIDNTGKSAHICNGGLYYFDGTDVTYTYSDPSGTSKTLLTTTWKYVTINVDKNAQDIHIYVDGESKMNYGSSKEIVRTAVAMFSNAVDSLGGQIFIRKPLSEKAKRNTSTNLFDEVVFDEYLTQNQINDLHDSKLGKMRIHFNPNISVSFDDIVGTSTLTVPPYQGEVPGYTFQGYYFDSEHTQLVPENYVTNHTITIYPYFTLNTYTITYHLFGGVNNDNNPVQYNTETEIIFLDATKEGYTFAGWYRTEKFENKVQKLVVGSYGDIDLYAQFVPINTYTISYVLDDGLFVNEPTETFKFDDGEINIPDAWKPGYVFLGWYLEDTFVNKVTTINASVCENVTLYARFTKIYYITYIYDEDVILSEGYTTSFTAIDEQIILPEATKDGYVFKGWYSDEAFTELVESVEPSVASDLTLYAKFIKKSTPQKTGCGGSVIATSITLSILSILGLATLTISSRERRKHL